MLIYSDILIMELLGGRCPTDPLNLLRERWHEAGFQTLDFGICWNGQSLDWWINNLFECLVLGEVWDYWVCGYVAL